MGSAFTWPVHGQRERKFITSTINDAFGNEMVAAELQSGNTIISTNGYG